jgi:GT2 family glycosyltransferase
MAQSQTNSRPAAAPAVSVVVCSYTERRWEGLQEAVASIARQTHVACETIVVIDHDDALERRARTSLAGTRVVTNSGEPGLSGARNSGVSAARGEIVAFLDDDAVAGDMWLAELAAAFGDDNVVGAGGVATPRWPDGNAPRWLPEEFYWTIGCSYRGLPARTAPVRNPIGASMSFRRSVLERIDGFTDGIGRVGTTPLGCEETELSIRARREYPGAVVLHVPDAIVEHAVPADRLSWRYFRRRCWAEGISKALVSGAVGSSDALASEWTYTLRTLPSGALIGVVDAVRGDSAGLLRSGAIVAGLVITSTGYLCGRLATVMTPRLRRVRS